MKSARLLYVVTVALLAATPVMASNTWYVDGIHGNDDNNCKSPQTACKTIGHAISMASSDDTIEVAPATYSENLTIQKSLQVIGSGATATIIDGNQAGHVVLISGKARVHVSLVTIRNGSVRYGGGIRIYNNATLTISQSTVSANSATFGGGIYNEGVLTVNNSIITTNVAYEGGGIDNAGTATISNSTIGANNTIGGYGGGIGNNGALTINNSTISANDTANGQGGGIWCFVDGVATINNSTISGNRADSGGGIFSEHVVAISNSTISGNSAETSGGGGVAQYGESASSSNTILANNTGGNCSGGELPAGYSLSDDNTCNFNGQGDLNNTQAKLGQLGNYGGPTQTIPEMLGSPTVDAGNPSGCTDGNGKPLTTDQRGYPRPGAHKHDKRCDMGAYERQTD
jgi:hypothetical protein